MGTVLSRRRFLSGVGALGGSALLAACAGAATPAPAEPAAGEPAAATVPPSAAEKTSVLYWQYMLDMPDIEIPILEAFATSRPDIALKWEYIPWDQYWVKLNATLAAGNPPDVWNTATSYYYEYILRNQLVDVSELLTQGIDMEDLYPASLLGYDFRGKYYGVPRNIVTTVGYFNIDLFEEAGVEPPPLDGDWTWDDCAEMAKAITTNLNRGGKTLNWGVNAITHAWWLDPVIVNNGGNPLKGEFSRDLVGVTANYDDSICCDTFAFQNNLLNVHKVSPPAGEFEGLGDPFLTGRLAMTWNLNWGVNTYKDAPFRWNLTQIPMGTHGRPTTYGGADGLVMSQATKAIDASWSLMLYLLDPKTGGAFLVESAAMPVLRSVATSDQYLGRHPDKNLNAFLAGAEISYQTATLGWNEWKAAQQTELDSMFLGDVGPTEACPRINKAVNDAMDRIREQFQEALGV